MKKRYLPLLLVLFTAGLLHSQSYIDIPNPSFEDNSGIATIPFEWSSCDFEVMPTVDIFDKFNRFHLGMTQRAADGVNYLGMITRTNNTWHSVSLKTAQQLKEDKTYFLTLKAAKALEYHGLTPGSRRKQTNYSNTCIIRIWGSTESCAFEELLSSSAPVDHEYWKTYTFTLKPSRAYSHIHVEAYYENESKKLNGNVLLDDLQPILIFEDPYRYKAIGVNGQLLQLVDTATISPDKLHQLCLRYTKQHLESSSSTPLSPDLIQISLLDRFQQKMAALGIRQYLLESSEVTITAVANALDNIKAESKAELLRKGTLALKRYRNGEASDTDIELFDQLEDDFGLAEEIEGLILNYVQKNRLIILETMEDVG